MHGQDEWQPQLIGHEGNGWPERWICVVEMDDLRAERPNLVLDLVPDSGRIQHASTRRNRRTKMDVVAR
jgi:hypothetical protein